MNEILKKRIEELPYKRIHPYNTEVNDAYNKGFEEGVFFALQSQWISVNKALPEGDSSVFMNVYVEIDTGHGIEYCILLATYTSGKFSCETTHVKVIAWLPIPKFEPKEKEEKP